MSKRMSARSFAAAAAAMLALSACGTGAGAGAASSQGSDDATAGFTTVDPALVQGLHPTVYADEARNVRAEVPVIASARQMTAALEVLREAGLRKASWADASEVRIDYRVVAAGRGLLGIMVNPSWQNADGPSTQPALVWYDAGAKSVYSSPVLIKPDQWPALTAEVTKAAKKVDENKLGPAMNSAPAPQGDGPMLGFNDKGDLIVSFAPRVLKDEAVAVKVPKAAAEPLLSEFGHRAAAAATQPASFDGTPDPAATPPDGAPSTPGTPSTPSAPGTPSTPSAPVTPPAAASTRPSTAVGPDCRVLTCVALTYDDGPGTDTPKLVDSLRQAKAPATFFQLGQMIQANQSIGKQVVSAGNETASHSMSHPNLANISAERLGREINGTADVFEQTYGRRPLLMRPPYGSHNAGVDEVVRKSGAAIVQWDLDTNDWQTRSTPATERAVLKNGPKANTIVLMHDIHPSTVAAAPALLKGLQDAGATLVTVSELSLNSGGYQAGHAYCNGTAAPKQDGFNCHG